MWHVRLFWQEEVRIHINNIRLMMYGHTIYLSLNWFDSGISVSAECTTADVVNARACQRAKVWQGTG